MNDSARHAVGWERFDSRRVPAADRNVQWARMTAGYLVPLDLDARGESIFGVIEGRHDESADFCRLMATPHAGVRTAALAGGVGADHYKVALALHGRVLVEQYDRVATLDVGDVAIYDTSDDYRVGSPGPFGVLIMMVPRDALLVPVNTVTALSATTLPRPTAHIIARLLHDTIREPASTEPALDTLAAVLRRTHPPRTRHVSDVDLLAEARNLIESLLDDHRLDPGHLAARLGVSRRRLYQAFDGECVSVAGHIRIRRLERARALLDMDTMSDVSVASVGEVCGFPDSAHFSRLFRRAYGSPPGSYRERSRVGFAVDE